MSAPTKQAPKTALLFAATNPCHLWDQALGLAELGLPVVYFSGYSPRRLLRHTVQALPPVLTLHAYVAPTYLCYGITRLTGRGNALARRLYRWQDVIFDRALARFVASSRHAPIHAAVAIPGQCLRTFQAAGRQGMRTVLNHASGPDEIQQTRIRLAYEALGLAAPTATPIHRALRLESERNLATRHCVASPIVKDQLISVGIARDSIDVAPYGVDTQKFVKNLNSRSAHAPFTVIFAGQKDFRKGLPWLLKNWKQAPANWHLHLYGPSSAAFRSWLSRHPLPNGVWNHPPLPQDELAHVLGQADALVLPSAEEAFGLVVAQALQCGTPCVVSEHVGAKILIQHTEEGAIVPLGDVAALFTSLGRLAANRPRVTRSFSRADAAAHLHSIAVHW